MSGDSSLIPSNLCASKSAVFPPGAAEVAAEKQKLQEEVDLKKKALQKMEKPLNEGEGNRGESPFLLGAPQLTWLSALGSLQEAIKKANAEESSGDPGAEGMDGGDKELLRDCLRCIQDTGAGNFKARENKEHDILSRKKVYEMVVIRVVFPNKMCLDCKCKPNETIKTLYRKVETVVRKELQGGGFYLYDTPPIRKFDPTSRKTLYAEGLAPGALVHFGLTPGSQVLGEWNAQQAASAANGSAFAQQRLTAQGGQQQPQEANFYLEAAGEWLRNLPAKPNAGEEGVRGGFAAGFGPGVQMGNSSGSRLVGGPGSPRRGGASPREENRGETLLGGDGMEGVEEENRL